MTKKSYFIEHINKLSKPKRLFEKYLRNHSYESCAEDYPAAVFASALVDEFIEDYPEFNNKKYRALIEQHAEAIGFISDFGVEEVQE